MQSAWTKTWLSDYDFVKNRAMKFRREIRLPTRALSPEIQNFFEFVMTSRQRYAGGVQPHGRTSSQWLHFIETNFQERYANVSQNNNYLSQSMKSLMLEFMKTNVTACLISPSKN